MTLQPALGLFLLCLTAWALGENRRRVPWRVVLAGLGLQLGLALLFLKFPGAREAFLGLNKAVEALEGATREGTSFVFGYLGGAPLPFAEPFPGAAYIFVFRALPIILVMSALSSLLFHLGLLQWLVRGFSFLLRRSLGISGSLGLSTAANVFLGMVEAPLLVRPYLAGMTRNELFVCMTVGMAGIAGTMMVLYAGILGPVIPDALGHILVSSFLSAPAGVLVASLMIPETDPQAAGRDATLHLPTHHGGMMDAVTAGASEGLTLYLHVAATIVVLVALVALANKGLALLPEVAGAPVSLQRVFGMALSPLAWCMGVPWSECQTAGQLLGTKVVLNEFLAYLDLARLPAEALSARSRIILTYGLCGFANFGSLGIMIGGLGVMAPERRAEIAGLGARSILAGVLATSMTGCVAALLL